jgi:elongation factor Ts
MTTTTISAADVAALRARTGVSILACKQALEEAGGDQEKAIEILRKRGIAQAVKKADRAQAEGAIFIAASDNKAAIVELKCETDFVARNDDFIAIGQKFAEELLHKGSDAARTLIDATLPEVVQKLGENITLGELQVIESTTIGAYVHSNSKIAVVIGLDKAGESAKAKDAAMHAAAMNPLYVHPEDVPSESVEKEREIWKEQMKNEKKPPEILEKIMLGKEKKFREENALTKQAFVKDQNQTVEQYLGGAKVTTYVRVTI